MTPKVGTRYHFLKCKIQWTFFRDTPLAYSFCTLGGQMTGGSWHETWDTFHLNKNMYISCVKIYMAKHFQTPLYQFQLTPQSTCIVPCHPGLNSIYKWQEKHPAFSGDRIFSVSFKLINNKHLNVDKFTLYCVAEIFIWYLGCWFFNNLAFLAAKVSNAHMSDKHESIRY